MTDSPEALVRDLLRHATSVPLHPTTVPSVADSEVLLALDVDGVHCLLLKSKTPRDSNAHSLALSPREKEIARMVAGGLGDKEIAAVLDISRHTVGTHLRRMYAKLQVASRAALAAHVVAAEGLRKP